MQQLAVFHGIEATLTEGQCEAASFFPVAEIAHRKGICSDLGVPPPRAARACLALDPTSPTKACTLVQFRDPWFSLQVCIFRNKQDGENNSAAEYTSQKPKCPACALDTTSIPLCVSFLKEQVIAGDH